MKLVVLLRRKSECQKQFQGVHMSDFFRHVRTAVGRMAIRAAIAALAAVSFCAGYLDRGVAGAAETPILKPIRIDPAAPINTNPVSKDLVVAGSPVLQLGEHIFYVSADETIRVGVQEAKGPGKIRLDMSIAEYVYVLDGQATIRDAAGDSWSLKKGDALLVPKGFMGEASVSRHFRSEFVQVSSAPQKQ